MGGIQRLGGKRGTEGNGEISSKPCQLVSVIEGIIQRSGNLMKEYTNLRDQYRPDWTSLSPLNRCAKVLETLANQAKEEYGNYQPPVYYPSAFSANVTGFTWMDIDEDYFPMDGFFSEGIPTAEDIERFQTAVVMMNSGPIEEGLTCMMCGCDYHTETECMMKHPYVIKNKCPFTLWKYAGIKNVDYEICCSGMLRRKDISETSRINGGDSETW